MERIKIEFGKVRGTKNKFYCGIGDGVIDGVIGYGRTQLSAMKDFIRKINDKNVSSYGVTKIDQ